MHLLSKKTSDDICLTKKGRFYANSDLLTGTDTGLRVVHLKVGSLSTKAVPLVNLASNSLKGTSHERSYLPQPLLITVPQS